MNVEGVLDQCDPSDEDMICAPRNCEIWDKFEAAAPDGGSGLDTSPVDVDKLLSEEKSSCSALLGLCRLLTKL